MVRDTNNYTPLHIVSYFSSSSSISVTRKNESRRNNDAAPAVAEAEAENNESLKVISLFCDTAIMVEQELLGKDNIPVVVVDPITNLLLPEQEQTSPLYLASKRNASIDVLRVLLATRRASSRTNWIAPITGGEPYWDTTTIKQKEYSSPRLKFYSEKINYVIEIIIIPLLRIIVYNIVIV